MYSDKGIQLISAGKSFGSIGKEEAVTLTLNRPSDIPWYTGARQSLIKSVKKCFLITVRDFILTFGGVQTDKFNVSNMNNERPIGLILAFNLELDNYLCPKDLLLGRSTSHCPRDIYEIYGNFKWKLAFAQRIVDSIWRKWQRNSFSTMIC